MIIFKISGERNSGTNFLENILKINGFQTYTQTIKNNIVFNWKHGIPIDNYKNNINNNIIVDIFIFRELNSWLISMYNNPYHIDMTNKSFKDFLTCTHKSNETTLINYRTKNFLNDDDNGKTIFQIREYKFNKIYEYKNNNKNVVFVNLDFISNENNLHLFLNTLAYKYTLKINKKLILSINHTKDSNIKDKNRKYNIDINNYKNIIDLNKNIFIEDFINNLTFTIK